MLSKNSKERIPHHSSRTPPIGQERSLPSPVGASFDADTLNDATAPVQVVEVNDLGLDHLETITNA